MVGRIIWCASKGVQGAGRPASEKPSNYFADEGEMLHRTIDEINQNINDFVVVKNKTGNLIATAALHKLDDKLGEIKGVAVK